MTTKTAAQAASEKHGRDTKSHLCSWSSRFVAAASLIVGSDEAKLEALWTYAQTALAPGVQEEIYGTAFDSSSRTDEWKNELVERVLFCIPSPVMSEILDARKKHRNEDELRIAAVAAWHICIDGNITPTMSESGEYRRLAALYLEMSGEAPDEVRRADLERVCREVLTDYKDEGSDVSAAG